MDLDLTEEQEMLRQLVRGLCETASPLTAVRELEDDPVGYSTDLWSQLAELDLLGLMLPEAYGGSGMTAIVPAPRPSRSTISRLPAKAPVGFAPFRVNGSVTVIWYSVPER